MTKTNKLLAVGKFFLKMMFKVSMGLLKVAVFILGYSKDSKVHKSAVKRTDNARKELNRSR